MGWQPELTAIEGGYSSVTRKYSAWMYFNTIQMCRNFPHGSAGKESACNAGDTGGVSMFNPWVGKIPWRRKWQPTPVFLPENSFGQRNLADYGPKSLKGLDMTEAAKQAHMCGLNKRDLFSHSSGS